MHFPDGSLKYPHGHGFVGTLNLIQFNRNYSWGVQKGVHLNPPKKCTVYRHKKWQAAKDLATCWLMNLIMFSVFASATNWKLRFYRKLFSITPGKQS